jgi:uncharacterized protein YdaU (DUF1376 family)
MAELPCMPLWWDAYLSDTTHLTCTEHGAYLLILGAMWRAGGDLPDDDLMLMRVTHLTRGQWRRMRPRLWGFMHPIPGGRFTQDKLLETFNAVRRQRKSQSDNAKARWLKKKGLADAAASSRHMPSNTNQNHIESYLLVQSSTQGKKNGSAEKQEEGEAVQSEAIATTPPTAPPKTASPEVIEVSSALKATKLVRRAS